MYNILIAGAGYLGSRIARDFKAKKQRVYALTRNPSKAAEFEKEEIIPVLGDLTSPDLKVPPAHFIVFCAAPDTGDEENYRRVYFEGMENLLKAVRKNPNPFLILYVSSTSVWEDLPGEWTDEERPADSTSVKSKILLAGESLALQSGYPAVVLRLSGIYGPGRNRLQALRSGKWPGEKIQDGYMNMIHVDDIVRMMQVLFNKGKEGEIYIGTDNTPVLRSEFIHWLSEKAGIPAKVEIDGPVEGKKLSNEKIKKLDFEFQYPGFREGYESLLKQEATF